MISCNNAYWQLCQSNITVASDHSAKCETLTAERSWIATCKEDLAASSKDMGPFQSQQALVPRDRVSQDREPLRFTSCQRLCCRRVLIIRACVARDVALNMPAALLHLQLGQLFLRLP